MDANQQILQCFLEGQYERLQCPQCENTFLTNVYVLHCADKPSSLQCKNCQRQFFSAIHEPQETDWNHYVLLEKFSLGLEYFCDAIHHQQLTEIPFIRRIGLLAEDDTILPLERIELFNQQEPDYRIIYIMERLEHLNEEDSNFFTEHVHDIDWMEEKDRLEVWTWVKDRYGQALAEDLRQLCRYYREHQEFVSWDLHGDNLMRTRQGKMVVMDPFTPKF
ncbi:MAG: hypothetical protein RLZZ215_2726 [Pseudomonadota bacterium]|jgi:hypothetical protein